jgi:hypothetical protein
MRKAGTTSVTVTFSPFATLVQAAQSGVAYPLAYGTVSQTLYVPGPGNA